MSRRQILSPSARTTSPRSANVLPVGRRALSLAALGLGVLSAGCPDTQGNYDAFADRWAALHPTTTSTGSGGACANAPAAGEIDGEFLFALSAYLGPKKPVLFDTQLTTTDGANGLEYSLDLQPLSATDRSTFVGAPFSVGPFSVNADGSFDSNFPSLTVPGEANPITTGAEIQATISIHGDLCTPADFICGPVTGQLTKPLVADLSGGTGSNFTMERLTAPGVYPEPPKVKCDGTLADPL